MEESGLKLVADGADAFARAMDRAADAMQRFSREGEAAGRVSFKPDVDGIDGAKGKVDGFDDAVGKAAKNVEGHASRMNAAIAGAVAAISNALINAAVDVAKAGISFVTDGVQAAGDLEQKLSILKATTGGTSEEMEKVRKMSIALGADMSLPATSATDATVAILELVKSGLSLDDAMAAARGTLMLATAAEVDAGEAAAMTAGIINAFGLEGKDAMKVVDQLAAAAAAGAGEISDYSLGFQQAGFAFNLTKQETGDLATALQVLIENGIGGSDAGTALKNAMMRLMNPTKEAKELMTALGISVYDANGNMKPFPELLDIFSQKTAHMTDEQRDAALGTIFLSDGLKAMAPLIAEGTDAFNKRKAAINESGKAEALAAAQMEGFNGAMAALKNIVDTVALTIGGFLLPILTKLINEHIAPAITKVLEFVTAFTTASDQMGGMSQMFAPVQDAIDGLMEKFPILQTVVDNVMGGWESIVANVLPVIQEFFTEHGDEIMKVIGDAFQTIQRIITLVLTFVNKYIITELRQAADFIGKNQEQVKTVFESVWNIIRGIIEIVLGIINGIVNVAMALMEGNTTKALNALKETWSNIWGGIQRAVDGFLKLIYNLIDLKLKEMGTSVDTELKKVKATFDRIWTDIKNAVEQAGKDINNSIVQPVKDAWATLDKMTADFASVGTKFAQGIIDGINAIGSKISDAITSKVQAAVDAANAIIEGIKTTISGIFAEIDRIGKLLGGLIFPPGFNGSSFGGLSTSNTNNYNLNVITSASPSVVVQSFDVMKAFAP